MNIYIFIYFGCLFFAFFLTFSYTQKESVLIGVEVLVAVFIL